MERRDNTYCSAGGGSPWRCLDIICFPCVSAADWLLVPLLLHSVFCKNSTWSHRKFQEITLLELLWHYPRRLLRFMPHWQWVVRATQLSIYLNMSGINLDLSEDKNKKEIEGQTRWTMSIFFVPCLILQLNLRNLSPSSSAMSLLLWLTRAGESLLYSRTKLLSPTPLLSPAPSAIHLPKTGQISRKLTQFSSSLRNI